MELLHIADTGTHLGGPALVAVVAASGGILAGAFFVFGLPAILQRREGVPRDDRAEKPGIANEDDRPRY